MNTHLKSIAIIACLGLGFVASATAQSTAASTQQAKTFESKIKIVFT
jgi:hypothetical protein